MSYLKYKLTVITGLALFCALTYDYCRNSTKQEIVTDKPSETPFKKTEIRNKENIEFGKIQNFVKATDLYDDFESDAEKAKQKYIGKTVLIKGQIGEVFMLKNVPSMFAMKMPVAGIMLFPETIKHYPQIPEKAIDFDTLPYSRFIDSDESTLLEEKKFDQFKNQYLDFAHYSEDFSHRSFFGGVYCMFSSIYFNKKNLDDPRSEKKKIEVRCKIKEYKKGGIVEITKFSDSLENKKEKVKSLPRVIAVGCVEITSE